MRRPPLTKDELVTRVYAWMNGVDVHACDIADVPPEVKVAMRAVPYYSLADVLIARDLSAGRLSKRAIQRRYGVNYKRVASRAVHPQG